MEKTKYIILLFVFSCLISFSQTDSIECTIQLYGDWNVETPLAKMESELETAKKRRKKYDYFQRANIHFSIAYIKLLKSKIVDSENYRAAIHSFKSHYTKSKNPEQKKEILYKIGLCYFYLMNYKQSAVWFEKVDKIDDSNCAKYYAKKSKYLFQRKMVSDSLLTFQRKKADSTLIVNHFDSINYSTDDKIITHAYLIKNGLLHGTSIEFNSEGNPYLIGQYEKGVKVGAWMCSDGSFLETKNGQLNGGFIAGCGTGRRRYQTFFEKEYRSILSSENRIGTKNFSCETIWIQLDIDFTYTLIDFKNKLFTCGYYKEKKNNFILMEGNINDSTLCNYKLIQKYMKPDRKYSSNNLFDKNGEIRLYQKQLGLLFKPRNIILVNSD